MIGFFYSVLGHMILFFTCNFIRNKDNHHSFLLFNNVGLIEISGWAKLFVTLIKINLHYARAVPGVIYKAKLSAKQLVREISLKSIHPSIV